MKPGLGNTRDKDYYREKARSEDPLKFYHERLADMGVGEVKSHMKKTREKAFDCNFEVIDDWWFKRYSYLARVYREIEDIRRGSPTYVVCCKGCGCFLEEKKKELVTPADIRIKHCNNCNDL